MRPLNGGVPSIEVFQRTGSTVHVTLSTARKLKPGYNVTKRSLGPTCKARSSSLSAWTSAEGLSVPVSSETRQRQKVLIWEDAENVKKIKQTAKKSNAVDKPPSNIGPSTSKQKSTADYHRYTPQI